MMTQRLWLGVLLLAGSSVAQAQVRPQGTTFSARPLTAQEGKVIVNAAWERDQQAGRKPDCSHLVHEVYTLAGYPYPYASSLDLYVGIGSFVRVAKPQAGDLVVWRGHVGIVVDPAEHSFYSSVRSGLRTEFYDAPHWKAQGPARYYRYAVAKPANLVLARDRPPKTPRESPSTNSEPAFEDHPIAEGSDTTGSAVPGPASPSTRATFEIPSSVRIATAQDKPSQEEIARAISDLNSATGHVLREQDSSHLRGKVIIYDDLTLESARIKGKHGSAQARIESPVTLVGESIEQMHLNGKLRWDLLRMNDGWQVLAPKNSIYVPREVAIRMLAARLALLTQEGNVSGGDSLHEQAQIVRLLSTLLH